MDDKNSSGSPKKDKINLGTKFFRISSDLALKVQLSIVKNKGSQSKDMVSIDKLEEDLGPELASMVGGAGDIMKGASDAKSDPTGLAPVRSGGSAPVGGSGHGPMGMPPKKPVDSLSSGDGAGSMPGGPSGSPMSGGLGDVGGLGSGVKPPVPPMSGSTLPPKPTGMDVLKGGAAGSGIPPLGSTDASDTPSSTPPAGSGLGASTSMPSDISGGTGTGDVTGVSGGSSLPPLGGTPASDGISSSSMSGDILNDDSAKSPSGPMDAPTSSGLGAAPAGLDSTPKISTESANLQASPMMGSGAPAAAASTSLSTPPVSGASVAPSAGSPGGLSGVDSSAPMSGASTPPVGSAGDVATGGAAPKSVAPGNPLSGGAPN